MQMPVVTKVSQATRPYGSCASTASSTASEIWSAILSGCPSVTDSDVKMCFCISAKVLLLRKFLRALVPVMIGLIRALDRHSQILRLFRRQRGQLHSDLLQVQPRHFFIQFLGQRVHAHLI